MNLEPYGNTWWSKKWLDSILVSVNEQILIQGIHYANRKQVISLDIIDNRVISVVKGPNGGSHNNYIVFPRISKEQIELFYNFIRQQPAELLALKNNTLNPSTEILLKKSNINLFDYYESIKLGCDCRDELPCKYIIATLLILSEKIDKNPKTLFKIHGFDLDVIQNFKIKPINFEVPTENNIVRLLETSKQFTINSKEIYFTNQEKRKLLPTFNFNTWKDYSQILPTMLQNFPSFCPAGNFRKSFTDELEGCRDFFSKYESFNVFCEHYRAYNAKTFLMENESIRIFHKKGWHWSFEQNNDGKIIKNGLTTSNIIGAICCLSSKNLTWHHYSVRYLHLILQVAYNLIKTLAIYPQVFWINKDTAQIRWLPAEMLPEVLSIVNDLENLVPENFTYTEENDDFYQIINPAEHILSLFLSQLLKFARTYKTPLKTNHGNLLSFFFDSISGKLTNNAHDIPKKIEEWFSVYSSLDYRTQIVFVCHEIKNDIALEIFIIDDNKDNLNNRTKLSNLFENNDSRLLSILNILNGIADSFKPLNTYLENKANYPIFLNGQDLLQFLEDSLKKLEIFGIQTEIPKNLLNITKPKSQIRLQGNMNFHAFNAKDLLDFDWEIAIGNETLLAEDFLKLAEKADGLLKYKSQYIKITKEDLKSIQEKVQSKRIKENINTDKAIQEKSKEMISQAKLIQACFTGEYNNIPIKMADDFKKQFEAWRFETEISIPSGLNANLRPYQTRGFSWMYKNLDIGFGCILADDMGLGKTLQVITFLLKIKQEQKLTEKKALVVMPAGLLCNWQMEIKKFAPELTFFAYHGAYRTLDSFNEDILLTTYATFRKDFTEINSINWQIVIIDEAQNIKNADSEQSKLLRKIESPMKIAMSGTPIENRLMEFWTIMDFTNKGFFPSASDFREKYETPIQKKGNQKIADIFKKITAPFMLRRLKTDKNIINDLPEKIIQNEYTELTHTQAALYQKTLEHFINQIELEKALNENHSNSHSLFKRQGIILQMILALKQICNHPATFLKNIDITNNTNCDLSSGKLEMLLDLLKSIQEQNEKTLIFTQFTEMGTLIKKSIEKEIGTLTYFYHGACSQNERNRMIKEFQENPECKVLILSLKAGGTGLNLIAASQVIHYDLWWNPAIESQATDRAFRIGQTKNVQVHRFITKGTFEEKINTLLETKKNIANMTISTGETWLANMNDKELSEIFCLEQ